VNYLPGPRIEAELSDTDARIVVEFHEGLGCRAHFPAGKRRVVGAYRFEMPSNGRRIMVTVYRRPVVRVVGQQPVKPGKLPGGFGCLFGRAVVAYAGDELEQLVNVMVEPEGGIVRIADGKQGSHRKIVFGQIFLNVVGECHFQHVVFAVGATLEEEFSLFGDDNHFWCAAISARQGPEPMDYPYIVMTEDANKLLG